MNDLADKQAIADQLARYTVLVDRFRFDELDEIFTSDVEAQYSGSPRLAGVDALRRYVSALERFRASTHALNQVLVEVEGDRAHSHTYCTNGLVYDAPDGTARVALRACRYLDEWVRTAAGWRISAREHIVDWAIDVAHDEPQRLHAEGPAAGEGAR